METEEQLLPITDKEFEKIDQILSQAEAEMFGQIKT